MVDVAPKQVSKLRATRTFKSLSSGAAILLMLVPTAIGAAIDGLNGTGLGWSLGIGLISGALLASIFVCRNGLWAIVPLPPLIYFAVCALDYCVGNGSAFKISGN